MLISWLRVTAVKQDRAEAAKGKGTPPMAGGGSPKETDARFQVLRVWQVLCDICEMILSSLLSPRWELLPSIFKIRVLLEVSLWAGGRAPARTHNPLVLPATHSLLSHRSARIDPTYAIHDAQNIRYP